MRRVVSCYLGLIGTSMQSIQVDNLEILEENEEIIYYENILKYNINGLEYIDILNIQGMLNICSE